MLNNKDHKVAVLLTRSEVVSHTVEAFDFVRPLSCCNAIFKNFYSLPFLVFFWFLFSYGRIPVFFLAEKLKKTKNGYGSEDRILIKQYLTWNESTVRVKSLNPFEPRYALFKSLLILPLH